MIYDYEYECVMNVIRIVNVIWNMKCDCKLSLGFIRLRLSWWGVSEDEERREKSHFYWAKLSWSLPGLILSQRKGCRAVPLVILNSNSTLLPHSHSIYLFPIILIILLFYSMSYIHRFSPFVQYSILCLCFLVSRWGLRCIGLFFLIIW